MFLRRLFTIASTEREISKKKLIYLATKRGIVENEIIFDKFIKYHFNSLNEVDINLFNELLLEYDWDIFAWITGQRKAPQKYFNSTLFHLLKESTIKK